MLVNRGDSVLVEDPSYAGALSALRPLGPELLPVEQDGDGVLIEAFERAIVESKARGRSPRLFYTVPTGQNPSGATTSNDRKAAIYSLCERHNILIVEDDPYWFLQYEPSKPPLRSYSSMDKSGRVIRLDSFSKLLSAGPLLVVIPLTYMPGMRLGWVSGPKPLLDRLELHQQTSSEHTSGLSQALAARLLEHWGERGFDAHKARVQAYYASQCRAFLQSATTHLTGLASWNRPKAGMFIWLKLHGIEESQRLIEDEAVKAKVLLVPGKAFSSRSQSITSPFARASFSMASAAQIDIALERLGTVLRSVKKQ